MVDEHDPLPGPVLAAADPQLCKNAIDAIAARLMNWQKRAALLAKRSQSNHNDRGTRQALMADIWREASDEIEHLICCELNIQHGKEDCSDCWADAQGDKE